MADGHDQFLPLFMKAQPDLRAFIGALVRDPATREDVFQEVAMILWKTFDRYDSTRPFGAWARGVAARKVLEDRRLRARLPESCAPEALEALSTAFETGTPDTMWQERETALRYCIELLPERAGRFIRDRYQRGLDMETIAREAGLSLDAIYQTLSRVRRQLRDCVHRRLGAF